MKSTTMILLTIIFTFFACLAYAGWRVDATWQIGNAAPTYQGYGSTKESALQSARNLCSSSQPLESYRYYCMNSPVRELYSELPGGSYIKSCSKCRMEGSKLVCDLCKPVLERRELDVSQCAAERRDTIENCHGELSCTTCNG
jgi:hypothetical protein